LSKPFLRKQVSAFPLYLDILTLRSISRVTIHSGANGRCRWNCR
jgi:hypothetical protein